MHRLLHSEEVLPRARSCGASFPWPVFVCRIRARACVFMCIGGGGDSVRIRIFQTHTSAREIYRGKKRMPVRPTQSGIDPLVWTDSRALPARPTFGNLTHNSFDVIIVCFSYLRRYIISRPLYVRRARVPVKHKRKIKTTIIIAEDKLFSGII